MLQMICDKCGADCGLIAYDVLIRVLHNPSPVCMGDTSEPKITCDNSSIRMLLCQDCYRKLGMPNIYTAIRKEKLTFRDSVQSTQINKLEKSIKVLNDYRNMYHAEPSGTEKYEVANAINDILPEFCRLVENNKEDIDNATG